MPVRTARVLLTGVMLACGFAPPALGQKELNQRIQSAITASKLGSAKVAVSVRDLSTGMDVADIDADAPMKPASNMKLLTSGTALLVLGTDFAFKTELVIDGPAGSERLVIVGSGDPALADPSVLERMDQQVSVESMITQLAGAVKSAGLTRLTEVVVDDRVFDRQWVHPTWPKEQLDKWYCAPVCGVNFHANVLSVYPSPSPEGLGRPPVVLLEPMAPWIEIENKARTVDSGKNSVWMSRSGAGADANHFTLFGEVRTASKQPMDITLIDVPRLAGQLFAAELVKQGVTVGTGAASRDAALRLVRMAEDTDKFSGRVVGVVSTHMSDVMSRCNTDSHNLYAEAMIKRIGREVTGEKGSWTNGSSVVRMSIGQASKLGPRYAAATVIVDGSGLSKENRVSPATFTHWLDEMQKDRKIGAAFKDSLAAADNKASLKRRFQNERLTCELNAKTGTIDEVRCLSGYLTDTKSGRVIAFSIMINGLNEARGEGPEALQCQERIVAAIDRWMAGSPSRANASEN